MIVNIEDWKKNTNKEIEHWDIVLREYKQNPDSYFFKYVEKRLSYESPLQKTITTLFTNIKNDPISILDVGSGPLPFLGRKTNRKISLTAIDTLALEYYKLYDKYQVFPPLAPVAIDATNLSSHYVKNAFDIVYARNSIDHTFDPIKCIYNMIFVSKKYIVLEHKINEGEIESYQGLHQWNFNTKNNKFYITDKDGYEMCINEIFNSVKITTSIVEEEEEKIKNWLLVIIEI
jgi:hypothetical protein